MKKWLPTVSTCIARVAYLSFPRWSSVISSFFPSACPEMNARCPASEGSTANTNSFAAAPEFLRTMLVAYFATCVVRSTFRVTSSFTRSAHTDAERRMRWQRSTKRRAMFWTTTVLRQMTPLHVSYCCVTLNECVCVCTHVPSGFVRLWLFVQTL